MKIEPINILKTLIDAEIDEMHLLEKMKIENSRIWDTQILVLSSGIIALLLLPSISTELNENSFFFLIFALVPLFFTIAFTISTYPKADTSFNVAYRLCRKTKEHYILQNNKASDRKIELDAIKAAYKNSLSNLNSEDSEGKNAIYQTYVTDYNAKLDEAKLEFDEKEDAFHKENKHTKEEISSSSNYITRINGLRTNLFIFGSISTLAMLISRL